jgi:hypothetical protein
MRTLPLAFLILSPLTIPAQQNIGSVAMQDATVAGSLEVTSGRAVLVGSSSVTARDHTAEITLARGGAVKVCQTSALHLSSGASSTSGPTATPPLMLALDRGAVEVKTAATPSDVLLTPDLRFTLHSAGPLDLRVRVTQNGDTCVESRGPQAPTIVLTDSFGESTYELHANQHVLFEHGSLREVVDHETSPCGCPPVQTMSLADAALAAPGSTAAAAEHPFPAAQSAGLAPTPEIPQAAPGVVHAQVAASLAYAAPAAPATPASANPIATQAPPPPEKPHGFAHAIGHFFHRLFGGD